MALARSRMAVMPDVAEAAVISPAGSKPRAVVGDDEAAVAAVARPGHVESLGLGVAFHVAQRLLADPPQLLFDGHRQPAACPARRRSGR